MRQFCWLLAYAFIPAGVFSCSSDTAKPVPHAYIEIESQGSWQAAGGWKPSKSSGLILRLQDGSGDSLVSLGEPHEETGYFSAIVKRTGPDSVKARIVVPSNPEFFKESPWETIAPPDTTVNITQLAAGTR